MMDTQTWALAYSYLKLHLGSIFGELTLSMYTNSRINNNLFQDISGPVGLCQVRTKLFVRS